MDNQTENFEQLQRLMKLKRHETPPPAYFNNFSRDVIAGIRAQRNQAKTDPLKQLESEAPWLLRLWRSLEARPAFAGAFGMTICAVLVGGIVMMEKPANSVGGLAINPDTSASPFVAASPTAAEASTVPLILASSNAPAPNLFDLVQPGQTLPAGFAPAGN
jgi:hypothetical protein